MDDAEFIVGLLLTHIDGQPPLNATRGLRNLNDLPLAIRERWMRQVDTCLNALHDAGIVWEDVKPENI